MHAAVSRYTKADSCYVVGAPSTGDCEEQSICETSVRAF